MKFADLKLHQVGHTIQMVGALYGGEGNLLMCMFPGEDTSSLVMDRLDMTHPEWESFIRQTDIMETEILAHGPNGTLVKALARKSQRQIDAAVSWKVFKRDGYRCRYCAADDVPLTVDHLVRWEELGPSSEANLVAACKQCNKLRGNLSYADWLGHPVYLKTSKKLTEDARQANIAVLLTLDAIPRVKHQRAR